jgi:hypothetical protein
MNGLVTERKPHPKNPEWRVLTVGEKNYVVFAGKLADALELGKALPDGTTEEPPKFDGALPSLRLPRSKDAPRAAWANTEEGEKYVQERMDRRTAIMQSVALHGFVKDAPFDTDAVLDVATSIYEWLRSVQPRGEPQEKGAGRSPSVEAGTTGGDTTSSGPAHQQGPGRVTGRPDSAGQLPTAGPDEPSGERQGPSTGSPSVSTASPDTAEGGTSSEEGEAVARSAQASGVKSPSRRCLHLKGTRTVTTSSGGRNEVCVECGVVIDRVEASA